MTAGGPATFAGQKGLKCNHDLRQPTGLYGGPRGQERIFPRAETCSRMGGDIAGSALPFDTVETAALAEGEPIDPRPQGANITGGGR